MLVVILSAVVSFKNECQDKDGLKREKRRSSLNVFSEGTNGANLLFLSLTSEAIKLTKRVKRMGDSRSFPSRRMRKETLHFIQKERYYLTATVIKRRKVRRQELHNNIVHHIKWGRDCVEEKKNEFVEVERDEEG